MKGTFFIFNSRKIDKQFSSWGGFGYTLKDCYTGSNLEEWNRFVSKYNDIPSFGFISYELLYTFNEYREIKKKNSDIPHLRFPLIWWGIFDNCKLIRLSSGSKINFDSNRSFKLLSSLTSNISRGDYINKVKTIKQHIEKGDVYQVNLSLRIDGSYQGNPLSLYKYMDEKFYLPYSIFFSTDKFSFLILSPELFLLKKGDTLYTRPIKGTLKREGISLKMARDYFKRSVKEKRELDMIVDVERNDFSRICYLRSVKVMNRKIEVFPNVYHTVATVKGVLREETSLRDIIENTFPSSSVTGAPKSSAIKIINQLEPHYRYIYTGGAGFCYKDIFLLAMGIRCILFDDNNLHIYTGSGI
ncbi:MAG: chorismate-binding protein, partial [Planctomycetota bacterium]